ncbi:protein draper-like [Neocloeon triangulifer]|uniref:protein draper-like n=1 Tax=Neocloeon triangulifer TaxID=2078957 RepID=UPI00286EE718|nr:protein draper-like [Neocloeon triangulifer]
MRRRLMARASILLVFFAAQCPPLMDLIMVRAEFDIVRVTSTRCSGDAECTENAECAKPHGFCHCRQNFVFFEDLCLPVATKIGDACWAEVQCQFTFGADSTCSAAANEAETGSCRCNQDSHFADKKCHQSKLLGERCASRSDCFTKDGRNAYCVAGRCVCHQEYHPNKPRDQCILNVELDGECTRDEECVAELSVCHGKCSCQTGAAPSADRSRCLLVAHELNGPCEVDGQCVQFLPLTECKQAECTCVPGTHRTDDKCFHTKNLNDVCEDSRECAGHSGSMICAAGNSRCRCAPGFRPRDGFGCQPNSGSALAAHLIICLVSFLVCNFS